MRKQNQLKALNSEFIILASTAQWRSQILDQLQIKHRKMAPRYHEAPYQEGPIELYVQNLALRKAKSLEDDFPSALIIAADQMAVIEGEVLGKPENMANATRQLQTLQGNWHRLVNGLCVIYKGQCLQRWDDARLKMRELTDQEISSYLTKEEPYGCCGSYKIESLGASLFEKVVCEDPNSIIGMPSNLLLDMLRELGFSNLL